MPLTGLSWILSGNRIGSPMLAILLLAVFIGLLFAPFLFPGTRPLAVAAQVCIFIVLVASYDVLLGYTGVVSFAHTMFFGIGAYGVAIALKNLGPSWGALLLGAAAGMVAAVALAFLIALLSLRVRAIFFAMITLAFASFALILASQLFAITGGEDGMTFRVPAELSPAFRLFDEPVLGVRINGRVLSYYLVYAGSVIAFLLLLRVVNSPFGRVLQAIRENEFRAAALGYRVIAYRSLSTCISAGAAAFAGVLFAVWLKFTGPDAVLSFSIMIDVLLALVIGGMGSMYGAVVGATLLVIAQWFLRDLMAAAADATASIPILPHILEPDRWLLWLGLLFILSVYFFPKGIVGRLRGLK